MREETFEIIKDRVIKYVEWELTSCDPLSIFGEWIKRHRKISELPSFKEIIDLPILFIRTVKNVTDQLKEELSDDDEFWSLSEEDRNFIIVGIIKTNRARLKEIYEIFLGNFKIILEFSNH